MEVNTDGLPPEMQERIAQIIEGAKQKAAVAMQQEQVGVTPPAAQVGVAPLQKNGVPQLAQRQPSLMDHTIELRQEVADMRNEVANMTQQMAATAQVVEAVGQAVGQLYATFQQQTTVTDPGSTYSSQFQHEEYVDNNDY